jgi:hypothetical protein
MFLSIGLTLPSIFGWMGTISYLVAYLLLSLNKIRADQKIYHVLNVVGALGLTYNAVSLSDFPNIIVNVVWGVIALGAILLIMRKKQN